MTPKADELLVIAAMSVRERVPDTWEQFVLALRQYSAIAASSLVRSPRVDLEMNQGKAQALADLAVLLQEAPARFENIRVRRATQ